MSMIPADQRELFLPLIEGIQGNPPWVVFMHNLVARTNARRAFMIITLANAMPSQEPSVVNVSAPRAAEEPPLDFRQLDQLGLHHHRALRPGRVYSLDEMLDYDDKQKLVMQRQALNDMGIRYGRWLRVSAGGAADAWLVLAREREDFSASAGAALSMVAPHLSSALRALAALIEQRLRTAMAEASLARLGVGQIALDATGRVMAADATAEALLTFTPEPGTGPGRRLQLLPDVSRALEKACAEILARTATTSLVTLDERAGIDLLLRRSELALAEPDAKPTAIGTLRMPTVNDARSAASTLAALHGLSDREAALAIALSNGDSLIEAGRSLRLTDETTRNYSKRIFAKTRTRGQADLVRVVLRGLAPLA